MAGGFSTLASNLYSPAVGLVFILSWIENFTTDGIFDCPCDESLSWRIACAMFFLLCPCIMCFVLDGRARHLRAICKHRRKRSCHHVVRPLLVGMLWIIVYMMSKRFPACFVENLPCCDETLIKTSTDCDRKKVESRVQTAVACLVLVVTVGAVLASLLASCLCNKDDNLQLPQSSCHEGQNGNQPQQSTSGQNGNQPQQSTSGQNGNQPQQSTSGSELNWAARLSHCCGCDSSDSPDGVGSVGPDGIDTGPDGPDDIPDVVYTMDYDTWVHLTDNKLLQTDGEKLVLYGLTDEEVDDLDSIPVGYRAIIKGEIHKWNKNHPKADTKETQTEQQ